MLVVIRIFSAAANGAPNWLTYREIDWLMSASAGSGFWVSRISFVTKDPGSSGLCSLGFISPKADSLVVSHSREFLQG